jgi:Icc-related predicted phosphoesterase
LIRVAAFGDVHMGSDAVGRLRGALADVRERADVLLIAGDLTRCGSAEEGRLLAGELTGVGVPIVCVLGNHDYESDQAEAVGDAMREVGATVLEGSSIEIPVRGQTLGVAGTVGFGGGFPGASASDFGEPEMKAFVRHSKRLSQRLGSALGELATDCRVALTHYSPVPQTLVGERREIYPFLGSSFLAEAIDRAGADLALHGHAHQGSERGRTPGGVPVRNVAQPLIRRAYRVFRLAAGKSGPDRGAAYDGSALRASR